MEVIHKDLAHFGYNKDGQLMAQPNVSRCNCSFFSFVLNIMIHKSSVLSDLVFDSLFLSYPNV